MADTSHEERDRLSKMRSVLALAMMMASGGRTEHSIVRLAVTAVPALVGGQCHATYVTGGHDARFHAACSRPTPDGHMQVGRNGDGAIERPNGGAPRALATKWVRAFPVESVDARCGFLLVDAPSPPPSHDQFLLSVLAQQTGTALASARLVRGQREQAEQLRRLTTRLTDTNARLTSAVTDLEHRAKVRDVLARVSFSGAGEQGIVRALHTLTGRPVFVEDAFGNVRSWAGAEPAPQRRAPWRRAELLGQAEREGETTLRDGDRLLALVRPQGEVLGVVGLIDPDESATEADKFTLEHGAMVLATELAHQRAMAEVELRLRRDLVDDLLAGTDDSDAYARAEALGHNLHPPQHVVAIERQAGASDDALVRAVSRTAASLELSYLLTTRTGTVVLLVEHTLGRAPQPWDKLHRGITTALRTQNVKIGVGRPAARPADIPRSWQQALRSLAVRRSSCVPAGVTSYDDLGIVRLLGATGGDAHDLEEFIAKWLGPLLDYDASHTSNLVATLSAYIACGGNYDDTATAVHVHRSTLRYRLARIRDITGYDLHDPEQHLNLHLATQLLGFTRHRRPTGETADPP